jgi:hypothetical protein
MQRHPVRVDTTIWYQLSGNIKPRCQIQQRCLSVFFCNKCFCITFGYIVVLVGPILDILMDDIDI